MGKIPNCDYDNIKKIIPKDLHCKKILFKQMNEVVQSNNSVGRISYKINKHSWKNLKK